MKWVSDLYYEGHELTVMELKIEKDNKPEGSFQWVTGFPIRGKTAWEFAQTGRKRWKIENEGQLLLWMRLGILKEVYLSELLNIDFILHFCYILLRAEYKMEKRKRRVYE